MDDATIPYWMAFLVGPTLLAFAVAVVPARLKCARQTVPVRQLSSARINDAVDAWFPFAWAVAVGVFGAVFVTGGMLRLAGIDA